MPAEVREALDKVMEDARLHGKQKWLAATAAVLLLVETPDFVRQYYMSVIAGTALNGSYAELVERARSGALRKEAEAKLKEGLAAAKRKG